MPWRLSLLSLCALFCITQNGAAQENSVLAEGRWFKLGVTQSGVYKLSASFLKDKGIAPDGADPRNLQIRGYGGGMLPEPIQEPRPTDLPQLAIQLVGEADGRLDAADYVLFYAQGPDALGYTSESGGYTHQKNLYADTAYYFISLGSAAGLRQATAPNMGLNHPPISSYQAVEVWEKDEVNIITSGRRWFGDAFGYTTNRNYPTQIQELTDGTLRLKTAFINAHTAANPGKADAQLEVSLGGQTVQTINLPGSSTQQYANKGNIKETITEITAPIATTGPLQLSISHSGGSGGDQTYLDYFLLQGPARLRYRGQQLPFLAPQSQHQPSSTYQLAGAPEDLQVWEVSDPQHPRLQQTERQQDLLLFGASSTSLLSYIAFTPAKAAEPHFAGPVQNQNLRADLQPELLVITHSTLLAEAERLAAFRREHDGLAVKVVTVQQVYNEFSSGRQDVTAIRDYARYLYTSGGKLRYLLLFGRGYYDYKGRTPATFNLVPLYESYNSTHPIYSYASDDFYGFLEDGEGDWIESEEGNQSLEIGIGRLPVTPPEEARQVVDKLIRYSSDAPSLGNWRQRLLFVADDEDGNIHQQDAEKLAGIVEGTQSLFNIRKVYVDAYPKIITANSQSSPAAQTALQDAINQGALIVNFTGHGSQQFWTYENIFSKSIAEKLQNKHRLPLFVTATCEFGLHDGAQRSGAESLVLNPNGGAIGLLTTSRPVFSFTNLKINSAFYRNAFPATVGEPLRLGDIMRLTKNEGVPGTGVNNRNFVLLGDPSMQLAYPKQPAAILSITDTNLQPVDTLKALDVLRVEGVVLQQATGEADPSFEGKLLATVYDKQDVLQTLGQTDPSMQYRQRQNVLYRGEARVTGGHFSFEMMVPKNIRYDTDFGRIELYAIHSNGKRDAAGASETLQVGGSSSTRATDRTPPQIQLYLNDTTFTSGNPVDKQAVLLARFTDESGINISYAGVAQDIEAQLDDTTTYILNDYYTSTNGSFKEGRLEFPLYNLKPGTHQLRLQAWDTQGNRQEETISFYVPGQEGISISQVRNFPNPLRTQTTFSITHNRSGDDLELTVLLYNRDGRLLDTLIQRVEGATGTLHLPASVAVFKNLSPGLYVYKVLLRSLSDGSVVEKTEKLIILY
jgi:hypothetical protein